MIDPLILGVGAMFFLIVLAVTWNVLPKMGYQGASRATLAICVAALCVLGLIIQKPAEGDNHERYPDWVIIIPHLTLGLTFIGSLFVTIWQAVTKVLDPCPHDEVRGNRT